MSINNPRCGEHFYQYANEDIRKVIYFGINPVTKNEVFVDDRGVIITFLEEGKLFKTWGDIKRYVENILLMERNNNLNKLKKKFEDCKNKK